MKKGLGLLVVATLAGCSDGETRAERTYRACGTPAQAFQVAKDFVRGKLKSPNTADFPGSLLSRDASHTDIDECTTMITSHVDAQNGFGATIRTEFMATVKYDRDTKKWTLLGLHMD